MKRTDRLRSALLRATAATLLALPPAAQAQEGRFSDCIIEPAMVVELGSPVEGIVERIEAGRGTRVQVGDPIAWLESSIERESLALAAARAESRIGVRIAEARLDLERKEVERARELVRRDIGTASDLDIAEAELLTSQLELERAMEEVTLSQLELSRAQAVLERRVIRSPIDGIILRRLIGPGEIVHSQAQIAQLADIDPLYVDVFLPTALYNAVRPGQEATVFPAEPIGGSYRATILTIDQVFDAASDTFAVRLELPNPDLSLPAGVDCAIRLDTVN